MCRFASNSRLHFPGTAILARKLGSRVLKMRSTCGWWIPRTEPAAAKRGFRGAAVSIALMRNGVPVLGVVHAYCAPDDSGDTFWWAEHLTGVVRNGREMVRTWPTAPSTEGTALVFQDADWNATANARMVAPLRFRTIPGIAYRLALVAAGEADVAITLNAPTSWDVAGGHALLLGAGGDLFGANGSPVKYDETGDIRGGGSAAFFGGTNDLVEPLISRPWNTVLNKATADKAAERLCFLLPGKTLDDAEMFEPCAGLFVRPVCRRFARVSRRISIARKDREAIP